jgi:hypothetical protein
MSEPTEPARDCAWCQCDDYQLDVDNAPDCFCGHKPDVHRSMIYDPQFGWMKKPGKPGEQ